MGAGSEKVARKKRIEKRANIIGRVIMFGGLLSLVFYHGWRSIRLSYDFAIIQGRVIKCSPGRRGGVEVKYEYYIAGKRKTGERFFGNLRKSNLYSVEGKIFPVACERADPSNSRILITKSDYEFFAVPFPDSMKWVKKNNKMMGL